MAACHQYASVALNGSTWFPGMTIDISAGQRTKYVLVVTAQDGITAKTYTVYVSRPAPAEAEAESMVMAAAAGGGGFLICICGCVAFYILVWGARNSFEELDEVSDPEPLAKTREI